VALSKSVQEFITQLIDAALGIVTKCTGNHWLNALTAADPTDQPEPVESGFGMLVVLACEAPLQAKNCPPVLSLEARMTTRQMPGLTLRR
jgi:hypothetical protein